MTIILQTDDNIRLQTFAGLKASIAARLDRDFEDDDLVDFIYLAEREMERRLIVPYREVTAGLTIDAQTVNLPNDFKEVRRITLMSNPKRVLESATPATLDRYTCPGQPVAYAVIAGQFWFGPVPDQEYSAQLVYQRKITPLSETAPSNWVLQSHPDAYFYGALVQAADFIEDTSKFERYRAMFDVTIEQINDEGSRQRFSGAPTRLRSPVVV